MRAVRGVALAALAVAVVPAAGHTAAPKPVCNLITDVRGDGAQPYDEALDVISADIGVNTRELVVEIRLAVLRMQPATAPTGLVAEFRFNTPRWEELQFVRAVIAPDGSVTSERGTFPAILPYSGFPSVASTAGRSTVDVRRGIARITWPLRDLEPHGGIAPGDRLDALAAVVARRTPPYHFHGDSARTATSYRAGTASCVFTPGGAARRS